MMRIRRSFILCPMVFLVGSYASAQAQPPKGSDPVKTALIEELLVALKAEGQQQQTMQMLQNNMLNQFNQMLEPQLKSLGDSSQADAEKIRSAQADVQDFQRRLFALITAHMSWQTMKPIYVAMYDETFTADELRPLVAFFKSPAGQAYINKTPALMNNTMKRMQQVTGDMMPDIQKLTTEFTQQMKEKYGKP